MLIQLQRLLPQHLLSRAMYVLTRWRFKPWKNWLIRWIVKQYDVDLSLATQPDPKDHPHFNSFFTRELLSEARPIAAGPQVIASPVDGNVSQAGDIVDGNLLQAKGRHYTLFELMAGDMALLDPFNAGRFTTIYLSPRDYHRIHMPMAGTLKKMVYVPGCLYSVNERSVEGIDRIFARNERLISLFDTDIGPMALIMVGAIFVGNMETVWAGPITPPRQRSILARHYPGEDGHNNGKAMQFDKGEEMGRFNMGSTVILLFGPDCVAWAEDLTPGKPVIMGQAIGQFGTQKATVH